MFQRTTAINKILALKKRIKIVQGGTSAGKTYGILPILIDRAACKQPNTEISVVSESIPHLRRGALRDFIKIMKGHTIGIPLTKDTTKSLSKIRICKWQLYRIL